MTFHIPNKYAQFNGCTFQESNLAIAMFDFQRVEPPAFPCFFLCCLDLISHGENPCNPSFNDGIPRFDGGIPVSVGYNKSGGILI